MSKDVLAAQAVNDGFLDPADMPEGSGPLPGEETVLTRRLNIGRVYIDDEDD
jgi:hypothetical protein